MKGLARALQSLGLICREAPPRPESAPLAAVGPQRPDFRTADGSLILDVAGRQGGTRDLRASLLSLAVHARPWPQARAILLIPATRMSADGIRSEWDQALAVLAPELRVRLGLVVLREDDPLRLPDDAVTRAIAQAVVPTGPAPQLLRFDRSFEVMRVLLFRWLCRRGRIAIGELGRQAGLSPPSVRKALGALGNAVARKPDRSAVLSAFPREQWSRLLAMSPEVRQTAAFVDPSDRGGNATRLLAALSQLRPAGVAVGGIVAARHWHPGLALPASGRLDLSVHAPEGPLDASFVAALSGGLVPAPPASQPQLVLHRVHRAESLFHPGKPGGLPIADPVEALLDLHELGLPDLAEALVASLRGSPAVGG